MSASLRPLRVVAFAVVALLMLAPNQVRAGTLIEYAGNSNKPPPPILFLFEFMSIVGSGL